VPGCGPSARTCCIAALCMSWHVAPTWLPPVALSAQAGLDSSISSSITAARVFVDPTVALSICAAAALGTGSFDCCNTLPADARDKTAEGLCQHPGVFSTRGEHCRTRTKAAELLHHLGVSVNTVKQCMGKIGWCGLLCGFTQECRQPPDKPPGGRSLAEARAA
jgi:hypothetical protein